MFAAEIPVGKNVKVESCTDAYWILDSLSAKDRWVATFGNLPVAYDDEFDVWRVPALANRIRAYKEAKAAECRRWGSE